MKLELVSLLYQEFEPKAVANCVSHTQATRARFILRHREPSRTWGERERLLLQSSYTLNHALTHDLQAENQQWYATHARKEREGGNLSPHSKVIRIQRKWKHTKYISKLTQNKDTPALLFLSNSHSLLMCSSLTCLSLLIRERQLRREKPNP